MDLQAIWTALLAMDWAGNNIIQLLYTFSSIASFYAAVFFLKRQEIQIVGWDIKVVGAIFFLAGCNFFVSKPRGRIDDGSFIIPITDIIVGILITVLVFGKSFSNKDKK